MRKVYFLFSLLMVSSLSWSQEYKRMIEAGTYSVFEIKAEADAYFEIVGTDRGKGYKPYKRWEYQAFRNMDENGMLKSPQYYFNELENYNNYLNQNSETSRASAQGNWEPMGPVDWNATSGWNPGVGRVTSIAVDPANSNHIIIGGETGGVWKTLDGGTSWTVLTDNMPSLRVYALAMDPTDTSVYFWGSSGGTIFKSTDSGSTWNVLADVGGGVVNKILIDPTNTTKMYCSAANGGLFKSTDSGTNWSLIHPSASTGYDIEFKPGDTNIIYATGTQYFKSTNGGTTFEAEDTLPSWNQEFVSGQTSWTTTDSNQNGTVGPRTGNSMAIFYINNFSQPITRLVTQTLDLSGVTAPEINFSYSNVNWAGDIDSLRVLYKSSSTGTWTELASYTAESATWSDITLSLPNPSSDYYIAFEGTSNYGRGLTLDDVSVEDPSLGVIFEEGFESAISPFSNGPKMMGVSLDNPDVVYVLEADGGVFGGLYKSTDSGVSFVELDHTGNNYFGYSSTADDNSGQAPRDMDVTVSPTNADEVHIAGVLTWRSMDGGVNFNITSQWVPGNAASQNIGYCHADVDILEYVGDKLYVGSDGGIFIANQPSRPIVGTDFYTDLTTGIGIRQFYKFGISQTDPVVITGGSQDNGTSAMDALGNWTDWLGADGMETFIDKDSNLTMYGTIYNGIMYRTTNGGITVTGLPSPDNKSGNWVTPFEQDPIVSNTIYSGFDQVYKSTNSGNSWVAISQTFGGNLNELKIAPSNNNVMYASRGSSLYRTTNGGLTNWTALSGFSGNINAIAIHPTNPNKVAIATTGAQKVYVSDNSGVSWTPYLHNLPDFSALALAWEDNGEDGLYLGMNYGAYYIDNTFSEWQPFSNNLPNVEIREFEFNTADDKLYAATYGRGVWRTGNYASTLSTQDFELEGIQVYPNPASNVINISWKNSGDVDVRLFDALGKLVYADKKQNINSSYSIDVSHLSSGLYFVRINNRDGVITKKVVIE